MTELFKLSASLDFDTSEFKRGVQDAVANAASLASKVGGAVRDFASKTVDIAKTAATVAAASTAAIVTVAVKDFAEYEQLAGGVETLFQDGSATVMENARKAFSTAGMSANTYMQTVTSFAASLLQGLGGNTQAAAEIANTAVIDMADNANKMGTDISMIMNAYQGFAKDNYTMLDNLKLGYGGTQAEMARLINDSGVLGATFTATAENVSEVSFDKIIQAIHIIQERMGIAGTTAAEGTQTIAGSVATWQAAWENLTTGIGAGMDTHDLVDNLITASENVLDNLLPAVERSIKAFVDAIRWAVIDGVPRLEAVMQDTWDNKLPAIVRSGANALIDGINAIFGTNIPRIEDIDFPTWDEMKAGVTAWWEQVKGHLQALSSWTLKLFDSPDEAVEDVAAVVSSWFMTTALPAIDSASTWALQLFGHPVEDEATIAAHVAAWWATVGDIVTATCSWTLELFGVPDESAEEIGQQVGAWWNSACDYVIGVCSWTLQLFGVPTESDVEIRTVMENWWATVVDIATSACSWTLQLFGLPEETAEDIKDMMSTWWNGIMQITGDFFAIEWALVNGDVEEAGRMVQEWWDDVKATFGGVLEVAWKLSYGTTGPVGDAQRDLRDEYIEGVVESGGQLLPDGTNWFDALQQLFPGFSSGLDYVPYDNFVARLHRGEAVLTAAEAEAWRNGGQPLPSSSGPDMSAMLAALHSLNDRPIHVQTHIDGRLVSDIVSRNMARATREQRNTAIRQT